MSIADFRPSSVELHSPPQGPDHLDQKSSSVGSSVLCIPKKLRIGVKSARSGLRLTGLLACDLSFSPSFDRYLPPRAAARDMRIALVCGKYPSSLRPQEKRYRRKDHRSDPFGPPRKLQTASSRLHTNLSAHIGSATAPHYHNRGSLLESGTSLIMHRAPDLGSIWNVGGPSITADITRITNCTDFSQSHVNMRSGVCRYKSRFLEDMCPGEDLIMLERRIALALGIDMAHRVLSPPASYDYWSQSRKGVLMSLRMRPFEQQIKFQDNRWVRDASIYSPSRPKKEHTSVPPIAFRVLEAPNLRDDFYCSVLAYSSTAERLAVGLGDRVYLWSEAKGVTALPQALDAPSLRSSHVTSLAFSSEHGKRAILAIARARGIITLWSPCDRQPRFLKINQVTAASHVSFRPRPVWRHSQRLPSVNVENEVLLVGDDVGAISVYLVEWPTDKERFVTGWHCGIVLHARIFLHTQQICGISWSAEGDVFATGANDNRCNLVEMRRVLHAGENGDADAASLDDSVIFGRAAVKQQWKLRAAVKAIAFCPWQHGLLAIGGGSNDRCIHFYHTVSGSHLASIDCAAQVTSLTWSTTRREIAATFGFAQPEHPFRIAVYSWPNCQQVVAIPWQDDMRALFAVAYPRGVSHKTETGKAWQGSTKKSRTEEGCLVVAASDGSIKFHEVWRGSKNATRPQQGLLGGSAILESMHGIEREGMQTIR